MLRAMSFERLDVTQSLDAMVVPAGLTAPPAFFKGALKRENGYFDLSFQPSAGY